MAGTVRLDHLTERQQQVLAAGALASRQFAYMPGVKVDAIPVQSGVDYVPHSNGLKTSGHSNASMSCAWSNR